MDKPNISFKTLLFTITFISMFINLELFALLTFISLIVVTIC
jgi:hypothetical protein